MTTAERRLAQWLHTAAARIEGLHLQRIESSTGSGIPDIEGCWNGVSFWLELKAVDRLPVKAHSRLSTAISPAQRNWLARRWSVGGRVFVLLRTGQSRQMRYHLFPGSNVSALTLLCRATIREYACRSYSSWTHSTTDGLLRKILHTVTVIGAEQRDDEDNHDDL